MQADDTVGINKHSDNSKLPSHPMESQLLLQPYFRQQTIQRFSESHKYNCLNTVEYKDTVEVNTQLRSIDTVEMIQARNSAKQEHS